MTATAEPSAPTAEPPGSAVESAAPQALARAEGIELLGDVHGSGYKEGAALVRRADGQMVHLGPLMYTLLASIDGRRDLGGIAETMSERLGRRVRAEHVVAIAKKLAAQGLLAGTEQHAPPRSNPLLALRWKVLVTNPRATERLTSPFAVLFRPWLMWPLLAGFVGVFWFVLVEKGVASATSQAFHNPGLLLLVFVLAVASAGFHELGHAAACRYGGATPGGMGMGIYLVWPAFYTDVTDSYRLPRRDRLRVDLGGLYFNAVVADVTLGLWLLWHADALLLLVALQVLQMVKQLSPIIRADGYHILSDATGVPDLYSHMGPTMRRLLPWRRHEPSALSGRARWLVTAWVLIVVPILLSMSISAVLLLPKLLASAWASGHHIVAAVPHEIADGQILTVLASVVRLLALFLPVIGSALVAQKIVRTVVDKARSWSDGRPLRRGVVLAASAAAVALMAWAWWPSGQYQPLRATHGGTIGSMFQLVSAPASAARPAPPAAHAAAPTLAPGTHLALAMIPVGGATEKHPALFVIAGSHGSAPVALLSTSTPASPGASGSPSTQPVTTSTQPTATTSTDTSGAGSSTTSTSTSTATTTPAPAPSAATAATAFPFRLPSAPGPGGTQALAENTTNGGVKYDVAYSLVTVSGGAPVTNTNSAFAIAHCDSCTTVAVSFQVVLVIGRSRLIAPINAAGSLNYHCPACVTTAIADQLVITLKAKPSAALVSQLESDLRQLGALPALGAAGTPAAVASQVAAVQQQVESQLSASGLIATPPPVGVPPGQPTTTTSTTTTATTPTNGSSGATTTPSGNSSSSGATSSATAPPGAGTTTSSGASPTATNPGTTSSTTPAATTSTSAAPSAPASGAATPGG